MKTKKICLSLLVVALLAVAVAVPSSSARNTLQPCGSVPYGASYNVTASPGVACTKARKIIKQASRGKHRVDGFACHSGRIGRYEYGIACHRGNKQLAGTTGA